MGKKALLLILDGWGIGNHTKSDAISSTPTPYWDSLIANYPNSQLQASGENVGLPDGQMGNSEVGHQNIGAGRILYQDLVKINKSIKEGTIYNNPEVKSAFSYAKEKGKKTATGKNIGKELQEQKAVNKVKAAMNLFCKGLADANINLSKVSLQDLQEALSKSATLGDVIKNI